MSDPHQRQPDPQAPGGSIGYWFLVTPGSAAIDPSGNGRPCAAVMVSTAAAVVTGKRGDVGSGDSATASPPLAAGVWHAMSFYTITAVSAGSVWAGYYKDAT